MPTFSQSLTNTGLLAPGVPYTPTEPITVLITGETELLGTVEPGLSWCLTEIDITVGSETAGGGNVTAALNNGAGFVSFWTWGVDEGLAVATSGQWSGALHMSGGDQLRISNLYPIEAGCVISGMWLPFGALQAGLSLG